MPPAARPLFPAFLVLLLLAATAVPCAAIEPLHARIDEAIEAPLDGHFAPPADDAEFVRRVYLDIAGKIPSADQTRAFLADTSTDKRARLIDQLLASPEYARRMQYVFDIMLMERRAGSAVPPAEWQEYLRESFAENKPYDVLAREILGASGDGLRAPARFYLDRGGETNVLTRDVGRLFFGMDLQCAQCHDHPLIDSYKQTDYYGLYGFLNRSFVFTDAKQKKSYFAEKAEGDVSFKSVFDPSVDEKGFLPRLPGGKPIADAALEKGQEYFVKPDKNVRPIPRYSRREALALAATDGTNQAFNENIANRLWYIVMGRGLVHPPGMHHADNPASHPALLEELGRELVAMKFDIKAFVRELYLSRAYQRSGVVPEGMTEEQAAPEHYAVAPLKHLSPEQMAWSLMEAAGMVQPVREAVEAGLDGDPRLAEIYAADEKRQYLRAKTVEEEVFKKLQGNVTQFVTYYGGSPGEPEQDFNATVHQALFFSNAGTIRSWLNPSGANLVARAQKLQDPRQAADELYISVLSREPTEDERLEAAEYLIRNTENMTTGIQEIAWALMASNEFRFNH